jgi:WhiB family redox-sensing transcriptional regulator
VSYRMFPRPGAVGGTTSTGGGDWRDRAACLEADPEEFFYVGEKAHQDDVEQVARRWCNPCPVAAACLTDGIATGERYGIRAGRDMARRRSIGKNAPSAERDARRADILTKLRGLADEGYSRAEAAITLKTATNYIARICNPEHLDILAELDANEARYRMTAEDAIAEVEHLIAQGCDLDYIATSLNRDRRSIVQNLRRHQRHDLIERLRNRAA